MSVNFIAGFVAYYFYSVTIQEYLEFKSRAYAIGQYCLLVPPIAHGLSFLYNIATGEPLVTSFNPTISESWYFLVIGINKSANILGTAAGGFGAIGIFLTLFYIFKALNGSQKRERLLFWGAIITLVVSFNDTVLGIGLLKYSFPIYFLGNTLEAIRFFSRNQLEVFKKLGLLEDDLQRVSKVAQVGFIAGNIAHDIRNGLAPTKGSVAILKSLDFKDEQSQKSIEENVVRAEKGINFIDKAVNYYVNLMHDKPFDKPKRQHVKKIFKSIEDLTKTEAARFNVSLSFDHDSDLQVSCHETEISLALMNMIKNSCDAIHDLNEKWIRVAVVEKSSSVEFSVTDSGRGIPDDIADKVFDIQFTTKELGKGTGLGLGLVANVMKKHGYKVFLDKKCKNTRFVIAIPTPA